MTDRHADSPSTGNPPAAGHDTEGVSRLLTAAYALVLCDGLLLLGGLVLHLSVTRNPLLPAALRIPDDMAARMADLFARHALGSSCLVLAAALALTLAALWQARRRERPRQEAQARFLRLTLLISPAAPLLNLVRPEMPNESDRIWEALFQLHLYAGDLLIRVMQCLLALLVFERILWGGFNLLTRRPLTDFRKFRQTVERALFWLIMLPVLLIAGSCMLLCIP